MSTYLQRFGRPLQGSLPVKYVIRRVRTLRALLLAVATHGVGNRPGRVEPREVKRRQKVKLLTKPRAQRRAELVKSSGS